MIYSRAFGKQTGDFVTIEDAIEIIQSVYEDFEREEEQGILQEDMKKAMHALAGKHACARILRAVEAREGVNRLKPRLIGRAR